MIIDGYILSSLTLLLKANADRFMMIIINPKKCKPTKKAIPDA